MAKKTTDGREMMLKTTDGLPNSMLSLFRWSSTVILTK